MFKWNSFTHTGRPIKLHLLTLTILLLGLCLPSVALAAPPNPSDTGPEQCAECHSAEMDAWQNSPHAKAMASLDQAHDAAADAVADEAGGDYQDCLRCHSTEFDPVAGTYRHKGVTCEACHGSYVEDHPKNGVMLLDNGSSICSDCHIETYEQWLDSPHAQVGVQCIGCHLPHSQDFRLTDEALCGACHRYELEDFAHTVHNGDITCTDCHLSRTTPEEGSALASASLSIGGNSAPSHLFTAVSSQACVDCHGESTHDQVLENVSTQTTEDAQVSTTINRGPELEVQLESVRQANRSLKVMTAINLGLGLGIGGILGVVFMLVVSWADRRIEKQ